MDYYSAVLFASAWFLLAWLLFRVLRRGGWRRVTAGLFVLALSANPVTLYGATLGFGPVMLAAALGLLIVAIRRIEIVGDVQSQMTFGMLLSLLLLLTPFAFILIPILVFWGPALSPDGRKDWRAFIALLMIGCLPTCIVAFGLWEFGTMLQERAETIRSGVSRSFSVTVGEPDIGAVIVDSGLWALAPVLLVQAFWARRRYVASTIAALAMPLLLYSGARALDSPIDALLPAMVALSASIAWMVTAQAPRRPQLAASILLLCSGILGWQLLADQRADLAPAPPTLRPSLDTS